MDWRHSEHSDEQDCEIEVLSSIFMVFCCFSFFLVSDVYVQDDFEELEPSPEGPRQFKIHLVPSLAENEEAFKYFDLYVAYTKMYPKEPPHYEIKNVKDLEDEDIAEIKKRIDQQVQ